MSKWLSIKDEVITTLIEVLEKQVEQEAIESSVVTLGDKVVQTYKCPICGVYIGFKTTEMNCMNKYCERCGQKVRMGDIDD